MKSKKFMRLLWRFFILISICSVFLFQEASAENIKQLRDGKSVYFFKMGTLAPDGVGWASLIKKMINAEIVKLTNGEVIFDWYYGGTMGDDLDIIAKMRNGQLQGGGFSGWGMAMACPNMAIMELPLLFNNYNEVEYVYSKIRPRLNKWFEKNGYHLLCLVEQDFDLLYSVKHELKTPQDLKKSRILTWYGQLEEAALKALGASPLPVRVPEVASSVRTGVVDAFVSPAIWAIGTQMYTVMKYINPLRIRYSPAGIVVTTRAWNQLPKELQAAIDKYAFSIEKEFRQKVRESNEKCYKAMIKFGMKETKMTSAELDVFKERLFPVWDKFVGKFYSKDDLAEIKKFLAEYRANH